MLEGVGKGIYPQSLRGCQRWRAVGSGERQELNGRITQVGPCRRDRWVLQETGVWARPQVPSDLQVGVGGAPLEARLDVSCNQNRGGGGEYRETQESRQKFS